MERRDNALEVCVYGVTDKGEKVCQDHFFLGQPADLNTLFQLVRMRNIGVVRIVLDIVLPVVNVPNAYEKRRVP